MTKIFTLTFFLLFFLSCKREVNCQISEKVLKSNDSILSKVKKEKHFSAFLDKKKLNKLETFNNETYRFVISDAFGNWQVYRISKEPNGYFINSKSFIKYFQDTINNEEIEINNLSKEIKKTISKNDWLNILNKINTMNFWNLPVVEDNIPYFDPTHFLIEGYNPQKNNCTNRKYHLTNRVFPNDSTEYKSIFTKVISLAK